jgi:hypothetical protein
MIRSTASTQKASEAQIGNQLFYDARIWKSTPLMGFKHQSILKRGIAQ